MPDEGVTSDCLVVLLRPVHEVISTAIAHRTSRRLGGVPLHGILGSELAEVGFDHTGILAVRQGALVSTGSKVKLPLAFDQLVDAWVGLASDELGGGREGGQGGQEQNKCGLHLDGAV